MTIHLQDVVRSEVEGGLAGPANPIPSQSIDCGCAQVPCPKLAKFATRRLFLGLMSWVGLTQAAAYAYFYVVGPTIARRFQFDPYVMEWLLLVSDLTPFVLGILVAYWGDRIHRAAWIGSIVLLQSASYFVMIIPHLTHQTKVIEDADNVTHMSLYADDSRELCSEISSRIVGNEDEPCYFTFGMIVVVQILNGVANIVYFTLAISYLDDNTKKKHIAAFIGVLIGVKVIGVLLGYVLAWSCLRVDAISLIPIDSYREQIGAWWLGLPILTVLLIVPGLLLSWFPRMLPSEVVEQSAATLLKNFRMYNRTTRRLISQKVGSPNLWPSLGRLVGNKITIIQVLACTLYITAIVNFMAYENLVAQSRFHVPKPTGTLLGFEDPNSSRLISNILKPILVGLIIIISGLVIAKAKPDARGLTGYSIVTLLLACAIVFALTAATCVTKPIVGVTDRKSPTLLQYCNRMCGCSNNADFRPVCDIKGILTFYTPCHAGCTSSEIKNGITTYTGCSCIQEMLGSANSGAVDGPCNTSKCQTSWLIFEFGTLFTYVLVASNFVGDLLVLLRSVYAQDKAIGMGLWMTCSALIANVPGKICYEVIAKLTCQFWGPEKVTCNLHDGFKLGNYICYFTGSLLALCCILKIMIWLFCKDLKLYTEKEEETTMGVEMQELIRNVMLEQQKRPNNRGNDGFPDSRTIRAEIINEAEPLPTNRQNEVLQQSKAVNPVQETPLKYGPLGPGDRRSDSKSSLNRENRNPKSEIRNMDSEDELSSSDEEGKKHSSPKVAYIPLDLDSDVESDLSNTEPRSRKRIVSREYEPVYNSDQNSSAKSSLLKREFPNPDNYEDPRLSRRMKYKDLNPNQDGSSNTSSFEFSKKRPDLKKGDFNEVGIPIADSIAPNDSLKDVKSLINRYELNAEQRASEDQESVRLEGNENHLEGKVITGIPLVAMTSKRPLSRGQTSSGCSSLNDGRISEGRPESRASGSTKTSSKGSMGALHTDFYNNIKSIEPIKSIKL